MLRSSKCIGSVSEVLVDEVQLMMSKHMVRWISQLIRQAEVMGPFSFPTETIQPVPGFDSEQNPFLFLRSRLCI